MFISGNGRFAINYIEHRHVGGNLLLHHAAAVVDQR